MGSTDNGTVLGSIISIILSLVFSAAFYVWLAFSLSKVFVKIGEPSWKGWVPVLNYMTLLRVGGQNPLWAIAFFLPLVSIAGAIFLILAVHNLNKRFGLGIGYTILAWFALPIWASIVGFGSVRFGAPQNQFGGLDGQYPQFGAQGGQPGQVGAPTGQYGEQYGQQYGEQYAQPQYAQEQYGQEQYGQEPHGQEQYGQEQYGQPQAPQHDAQQQYDQSQHGQHDQQHQQQQQYGQPPAQTQPPAPTQLPAQTQPHYAPPATQQPASQQATPQQQPTQQQPSAGFGFEQDSQYQSRVGDIARGADYPPAQQRELPQDVAPSAPPAPPVEQVPTYAPPAPPAAPPASIADAMGGSEPERAPEQVSSIPFGAAHTDSASTDSAPIDPAPEQYPAPASPPVSAPVSIPASTPASTPTEESSPASASATPAGGDPWAPPVRSESGAAAASVATTAPAASGLVSAPPIAPIVVPPVVAAPVALVSAPPVTPAAPAAVVPAPDFDDTVIAGALPDFDDTVIVGRKSPVWILEPSGSKPIRITNGVALLGRNPALNAAFPDAQLVLVPDSSKTMSKNHARIALTDGVWTIYDLNSTNGVVLVAENGEEIVLEPGASAVLTETFKLGELPIRLTPEA